MDGKARENRGSTQYKTGRSRALLAILRAPLVDDPITGRGFPHFYAKIFIVDFHTAALIFIVNFHSSALIFIYAACPVKGVLTKRSGLMGQEC